MTFITLTKTHGNGNGMSNYVVNCDKIHLISSHGDTTWVNLGSGETEFKVDQTPEEIMELIKGGNK